MSTPLNAEPIASWTGPKTGLYAGCQIDFYKQDEYTIIEIDHNDNHTEIKYRNVGDKNKEAAFQLSIQQRKYGGNRKLTSFSLPEPLIGFFVNGIVFNALVGIPIGDQKVTDADWFKEMAKIAGDPSYGDQVWRLTIMEKCEAILDKLHNHK